MKSRRVFFLAAAAAWGALGRPCWAASASRLCVSVSVEGRPLPSGFLEASPDPTPWAGDDAFGGGRSFPGPSRRAFARIRAGRICLDDVQPGNYRLKVSPLSAAASMELAYEGLEGNATGYRLTVTERGEAALYGVDGRRRTVPADGLRLAYVPPALRPARLEASLVFPAGAAPDFAKEPLLVVLKFSRDLRPFYVCRWLTERPADGRAAFSADVPEADLQDVLLPSGGWAVETTVPSLHLRGVVLSAGKPQKLEIRLTRGFRLSGTVRSPGGGPLRPGQGPKGEKAFLLELLPIEPWYLTEAYVAEDGSYEFSDVSPGWHALLPFAKGSDVDESAPGTSWVFMDRDAVVDFTLEPWALLQVGAADVPLAPLPKTRMFEGDNPREYRIAGLPAGTPMPGNVAHLYGRDVPLSLLQTAAGAWVAGVGHNAAAGAGRTRFSAGEYDFYLFEKSRLPYPAVRLLTAAARLRLPEHSTATLRMPGPYREGRCSLTGVLRGAALPNAEALRRGPSIMDVHDRIVPRVDLYLGDTWVATAFGAMTPAILGALGRGDGEALQSLTGGRWEFGVERLPPGRYRAVVSVGGRAVREMAVTLDEKAPARLEVDLAPPSDVDVSTGAVDRAIARIEGFDFPISIEKVGSDAEIALGKELFFEPRLSRDKTMSCSTCHQPERAFTDGRARAKGRGGVTLQRNTPSLYNVTISEPYIRGLFLDGRARNVEEVALTVIQHALEFDSDLTALVGELGADPGYARKFKETFGAGGLTSDNLARALAAYVRSLAPSQPSPYDRAQEDRTALSRSQKRGLLLFTGKAGCVSCHWTPDLTSGQFINNGLKPLAGVEDDGRYGVTHAEADRRAFKVPSLRNVALTGPYMHDGSLATLADVVAFYDRGGDGQKGEDRSLRPLHLSAPEKADLEAFLASLTNGAPSSREAAAAAPDQGAPAAPAPQPRQTAGLAGLRGSGCRERATPEGLLRALAGSDAGDEETKALVSRDLTRYFSIRAFTEGDPRGCGGLDRKESSYRPYAESRYCTNWYVEMNLVRAIVERPPDFTRRCREVAALDRNASREADALCPLLAENLDDLPAVCAKLAPRFSSRNWLRACRQVFKPLKGEPVDCGPYAKNAVQAERCRTYNAYFPAARAKDPGLCGDSEGCRVLMGQGAAVAKAVAARLQTEACGPAGP